MRAGADVAALQLEVAAMEAHRTRSPKWLLSKHVDAAMEAHAEKSDERGAVISAMEALGARGGEEVFRRCGCGSPG